ncbi:hypothetical protein [Nocardioides sp. REDSEA-S30_B4]|jgi:transcriptional regulator with XRE-family HTH domain|uniref:hypothetical protein n=1 Tax=Nocardioides sp. REDSEA-S30_B4 TaxID=1811552 RepID=UPI0025D1ADF6|nr:hypothetical protein [Nocardioides sp. REDSEA-S30_B4]
MKTYSPEHWRALGSWVAGARVQAGYSDTKKWAATVGRSTRQVLGLERGEAVGPKTIEAVAQALGVAAWALYDTLETGEAAATWSELRLRAEAEHQAAVDRQALASPEESSYWTSPSGDEADEPVTWAHMEDRLGELETRIARLERSMLRVMDAREGGDGDGDSAPTSKRTFPTVITDAARNDEGADG